MDIKKLPRFDRPGHRVTNNRRQNTRGAGYEYVHICIDDHSRWAFARVLPDEQQGTTTRLLENALAAYRRIGVEVKRLMTDNGPAYRSRRFATRRDQACVYASLHAQNERQGRALYTNHDPGMGVCGALRKRYFKDLGADGLD